jgi:hypothetical protein
VSVPFVNVQMGFLSVEGVCLWVGKPLLARMSCMVSCSFLYSLSCKWYVFNMLCRHLIITD